MSKYDIYLQEHSGTETDDSKQSKYEKYYTKDYTPTPHEYVEDTE